MTGKSRAAICLADLTAGSACALPVKLRLLRRSLDDIARQLGDRLSCGTNDPIFLSTRDLTCGSSHTGTPDMVGQKKGGKSEENAVDFFMVSGV